MKAYKLFQVATIGNTNLLNRIVMAPLTRCRAINNLPNNLMRKYYAQRSSAGLIITEGTAPSPNGLGYARIPGIFNAQQIVAWRKITLAVQGNDSKIFIQLMHTGRISHPLNMPIGSEIIAPSPVRAAGQMWTDSKQLQDYIIPKEMTGENITETKVEFVTAAVNAINAGFDGVELHGANGYLLEQFLSPATNMRKDTYGGNMENRCRFILEIVTEVANVIGKDKTGIRLSPYGVANDMIHYPEISSTYDFLSKELNKLGIAYIHLVDHSAIGAPIVPLEVKKLVRANFKNSLILCGGYTKETAEADIESGLCDLTAFGRPFINNPDLVERLANDWPLSEDLKEDLFYTADEKGYTDYPLYERELMGAKSNM